MISIFIFGCPLSRSDRFRTPGWSAYRNERFWISLFERKAAPLGRTAQEDEAVQFFGIAYLKDASPIVIVVSKMCHAMTHAN
ncbi:hypothetical protein [Bradyrhizobium sp. AS23.2]|uniref:hypothetical protein n=1 Tax=Bradyrhizobium sp. AS23.2 TaxID=1680155 RepID=UPI00116114E9|nr:hypothetical protein [Bradyrhizobium sp. AS23.2]